jgi:CDP-diacylglycerol--serine O-phosphatidyltransferase
MAKDPDYLIFSVILICLSLTFDFFDGFVARLTGASGELGKQLDSLADVVSFGLFPGILMISMMNASVPVHLPSHWGNSLIPGGETTYINIFKYSGLLISLFSALRLAKFNIDKEQAYYFKGLPTPANAIFIFSLAYIQKKYEFEWLHNLWILLIITILSSYLLIANLPLLALKFKNFTWKDNSLVFSFLLICIFLLVIIKILAIPVIIFIYIILSIIFRKKIISNGIKTA